MKSRTNFNMPIFGHFPLSVFFVCFGLLDWVQIVDRPANRGRYGNFSEDGPRGGGNDRGNDRGGNDRGGFDRNQREGSYGNNRDDR